MSITVKEVKKKIKTNRVHSGITKETIKGMFIASFVLVIRGFGQN